MQRVLGIRPGEGGTALQLFALMLVVWAGFAVGATGVESLFFARFGPRALPYLYVALGFVTFSTLVGMTWFLGRSEPAPVLSRVPLALAGIVLAARGVLELDLAWSYPVLWVVMMVLWIAQNVTLWGLAGAVSDTRQAKRLFPLYGAAIILGGAVGGLATGPLAGLIHAENLLFVWAVALAAGFALARSVAAMQPKLRSRRARQPGLTLRALAEGSRFVRASPLLRAMAMALVLFALLYFTLTLPFARAATQRFPDADELAAFLGIFFGLVNGAALLASLFLANRLFARFGVAAVVLALALIYLLGFAALSVQAAFSTIMAFRFVQMAWISGVWEPGWQALFNVVPPQRRGPIRTFMNGGPLQLGTVAAGLVLIAAERVGTPRHLFLIGTGAALAAAALAWRVRRAYSGAVVEALREGWPDVFFAEEDPFGGVRRDPAALSALRAGATDRDPRVRRLSLEILAELAEPKTDDVLVGALGDEPEVRAAALRALSRRRIPVPADEIAPSLGHPDPGVRARAVEALAAVDRGDVELDRRLRPLLSDPDPRVRARAAAALAPSEHEAGAMLEDMASSPEPVLRAEAVEAAAWAGAPGAVETAVRLLTDPDASVRRAAAGALKEAADERAIEWLIGALGDPDPGAREAVIEALTRLGDAAAEPLARALSTPTLEEGALTVLSRLPPSPALLAYARQQAAAASRYLQLWHAVSPDGDPKLELLAYSLRHKALHVGWSALRALAPWHGAEVVELVAEGLEGTDAEQRANALETLETLGEPDVVGPLLALWEASPDRARGDRSLLGSLIEDEDPWLRACAALAAGPLGDPDLLVRVSSLAQSDPDTTVRDVAAWTVKGEAAVETLSTLPLVERVLFLRKVPLFTELSPEDLKHVAEAAHEHLFSDGEVIAERGEAGDQMYIVVSGEIRVSLERERAQSMEVARRTRGEYVGEMAIISEEPRMASLIASGPVRTLSIDRKRFERILLERPRASLAVMRELCHRLRESNTGETSGATHY